MNHLIPNSMFLLNKHLCLWPSSSPSSSCNAHPKTLSFRATTHHHHHHPPFINPKLVEPEPEPEPAEPQPDHLTPLGSCFTNSSQHSQYSPTSSTDHSNSSAVETIVRGARSHDRLFFEPDLTSCSILESIGSGARCSLEIGDVCGGGGGGDSGGGLPYKESVAVVMETENPYDDFMKSMKEMVEIHELKDWDCLEELLGWYLRMNEKDNHEFIVGAFFDLFAGIDSGGGSGCCCGGEGGVVVSCIDHSSASLCSHASTCSSRILCPNGSLFYGSHAL